MSERLIRLKMKDGQTVEFFRDDDNAVRICSENNEIKLPNASGMTTTQLFSLLEPFGEIEDMEDDNE